ncbi:hypothetical protein SprV_0501949400 [Sparganum proliferum]
MVFAARQLQGKCQEARTHLYTDFVDLTKVFDTVNRERQWKIMQKFGCPERFRHIVCQLQDEMVALVVHNGATSKASAATNGLKRGCVHVPTLFSLLFYAILMDTCRDECPGKSIAYRIDGHLLSSKRMQTRARLSTTAVHDLLFVDDCALNTTTEVDVQRSMDFLTAGRANVGPTINTDKPAVVHQPSPNIQHCTPPQSLSTATKSTPWTILLISEAHVPTSPESMMRLFAGSTKLAKPSVGYGTPSGIVTASN